MNQPFTVAIVGGGLAGMAAAVAIARSGKRVALIERGAIAPTADTTDTRVLALGAAAGRFVVEQRFVDATQTTPILAVQVASFGRRGRLRFAATDAGSDCLGNTVAATPLLQGMRAQLTDVHCLPQTVVKNVTTNVDGVTIDCASADGNECSIRAELLVLAAGAAANALVGIPVQRSVAHYVSVVTPIGRWPHQGRACQGVWRNGVIAIVPYDGFASDIGGAAIVTLPAGSIAGGIDDGNAERIVADYLSPLCAAIGTRPLSTPQYWRSQTTYATRLSDRRCVVIGDAAQTMPPITAQGFNAAVADIRALCAALTAYGDDIAAICDSYATRRLPPRRRMRALTTAYAATLTLPGGDRLRAAALLAGQLPPVKRALLRQLLGND